MRAKRETIDDYYRTRAAQAAASLLVKHPVFFNSKQIACYFPMNKEFDSHPLITEIFHAKKMCCLPVLIDDSLQFVHFDKDDELKKNRYGIFEPVNKTRKIEPQQIDLVIAPLIAFDKAGHRLGTGGGYYDRTFAFLNHRNVKKKPFMLGLGFALQEVKELQVDPWDINLDAVLTEKEFILIR